MQILKYEIKKIFYKRSSIISLSLLALVLGMLIFSNISGVSYVKADGSEVDGIKAVRLLRSDKMKWKGPLTIDRIRRVINENRIINSDKRFVGIKDSDVKLSNMQFAKKQGFMDIRELINFSYEKMHDYDYTFIDKLKPEDASRFYANRVNLLKDWLSTQEAELLSKNEKKYLIASAKTLSTPFMYSYAGGYLKALDCSITVIFSIAFVICVLMASVFSVEYQTGSDAILLSTEHGRKKGIIYKLIAGLLSTSLVYWITSIIVYGIIFVVFGFDGGDSPIQSTFDGWKSFYHVTHNQAFWMASLLGYLGCIFIASLAMFLSSKVKTSFATMVFLMLIILVPSTIGKQIMTGSLVDKILTLCPHQMFWGWSCITTYTFFDVFGKVFTPFDILFVLYSILTLLLLPFTYKAFRNQQVA